MNLPIFRRFEIQRIDPEVVAPVDDAVQRLLVGQVECGLGDEEQEGDRAYPVFVGARSQLVGEGWRVSLDDAGDLLVDDLRSE